MGDSSPKNKEKQKKVKENTNKKNAKKPTEAKGK